MRVIIFGASGSGTTTLGLTLAQKLQWNHLDADDYYWAKTNPPFEKKLDRKTRIGNLKRDFQRFEQVIISGSLSTWGEYWNTAFDLGVFLYLPKDIRLNRLQKREEERYGTQLEGDQKIITKSKAFLEWASQYDNADFNGRSIIQHRQWIEDLACPVIEIQGDLSNEERIDIVLKRIQEK